ncbi:MAG TPA: DUF2163 domain-containing protein [Stellaceae bacterium]|nr:DUF2163 domain-containing protein [Stellaceae bacterium]
MRPCSAALVAYLAANDTVVIADLYTFSLASGEVLRYSGWTTPLSIPGTAFPSGSLNYNSATYSDFALGPRFGRSKVTTKIGVAPTELDIDVLAGAADLVGSFPFAEAVRLGLFDGATVELDRFFAPPLPGGSGALDISLGAIVWFYGRVADSDVGRGKITIRVKSLMNLLAIQQMPRRLYGAACTHVFGDAMCGYDRTNGRNALGAATGIGSTTIAALAGSSQAEILTSFAPSPATAYDEGTITATAGANNGASRTIARLAGGAIYLLKPFLSPVSAGDAFQLMPGCDHTVATCNGTLNNLLRYGGFPYIPPPETAA